MRKELLTSVILGVLVISLAIFGEPAAVHAQGTAVVPVYRFYFKDKWLDGPHFYSTEQKVPGADWRAEGIAFYISRVQLPYTVPLYVVSSWQLQEHFYTVNIGARDHCVADLGYLDKGILGYVLPADKDLPGSSLLYRWVRAYTQYGHAYQDHFYQTNATPWIDNYTSEGVECRVWTQPLNLPQRLLELSIPVAGTTLRVSESRVISWKVWSKGGNIRLSYSTDGGSSWQPITTVANNGNYGDVNKQSYNWTVPVEAVGKITIKVDWLAFSLLGGSTLPLATDKSGPLTVVQPGVRVVRPRNNGR